MPAPLSTFIGRRKELAEIRRLLAHTRLLTLLGPGGSGKSRLATEFVRQRESRSERVLVAELGEITDGALVVDAIAQAGMIRLEGRDRFAALSRELQDCRLLMVDNCEHLVAAAADVVGRLLAGCPGLLVIATSRERLNLEGETVWNIPPLGLPAEGDPVAAADASDAVRLFVDRARSARPGFNLDPSNTGAVLTICRRLDGIPLAIELAAARLTTFSPTDIVPRLEDSLRLLTGGARNAAGRQQTLRATIDWSYALLEPAEQRLLARLSVFAGAPDADAVQEVCAFAPLDRGDVLDALTGLVEKSMVQVEPGERMRYRLLETIREYAAEKLVEEGEESTARDHHLARYARLTAAAYDARRTRGATVEHRELWREMNEVRVALDWAQKDAEVELQMLGGLYLVWMANAPVEGFERISAALERADPRPSEGFLRAGQAWNALGGITGLKATYRGREEWVATEEKLLSLMEGTDNQYYRAVLLMGLGYVAEREQLDYQRAYAHMVTGVELLQTLGPGPQLAMSMGSLGSMEVRLGRPEVGRAWIQKSVAMTLEVDDQFGAIGAYFHLGQLELDHGSRDQALAAFLAGLDLVEVDDTLSTTGQVLGVACAIAGSQPAYALRLFSAAARLLSPLAPPLGPPWGPRVEPGMQEARAGVSEREAAAAEAGAQGLNLAALLAEVRQHFASSPAPPHRPTHRLSRRELEIAELVALGMTSRAIAEKLFLAERTVETHLNNIMTKLGFNSRAQVAAWVATRA